MILLWGIESESPLARVRTALERRRAPAVVLNQRRLVDATCQWRIDGDRVTGTLAIGDFSVALEDVDAIYTRAIDCTLIPEVARASAAGQLRARAVHEALITWCNVAPVRVVNRPAAMGSNVSKPYQAALIARHGFAVPDTLVTNRPELVRAFVDRHRQVVYKSASGVRSIARLVEPADLERLDAIRWCPTQFQRFVDGLDVRVHVVGPRAFATAIDSAAIDYRYARREGHESRLHAVELDEDVAHRCVQLARSLDLPFAGIDLICGDDEIWYCLEVNPSPAFSYFEGETGQPIADAVAAYLMGEAG